MATQDHTLDLDIAFFKELFYRAYPEASNVERDFSAKMLISGVIQIESLFELAVANVGKLIRESVVGRDFTDGSDAKKTSVRTSNYGGSYSAQIGGVHNKTGLLRVMCYERKQNKFYYFALPHSSYKHVKSTSTIEIPFELDGSPRRIPKRSITVISNWWSYQVDSFKEMASITEVVPMTVRQMHEKYGIFERTYWS